MPREGSDRAPDQSTSDQEKGTLTESSDQAPAESTGGLGLSGLSMNEIAPQATTEASEVARRAGKKWLWIIIVLAVVGVGAFLLRSALNLPPSQEVAKQFEGSSVLMQATERGIIRQTSFISGSKLRIDFSPNYPLASQEARDQLRQLTEQLMEKLADLLPGRDLSIAGFQGDHQMLKSRYLYRSTLVNKDGTKELDIVTHIEGDPQGGVSEGLSAHGAGGE